MEYFSRLAGATLFIGDILYRTVANYQIVKATRAWNPNPIDMIVDTAILATGIYLMIRPSGNGEEEQTIAHGYTNTPASGFQ